MLSENTKRISIINPKILLKVQILNYSQNLKKLQKYRGQHTVRPPTPAHYKLAMEQDFDFIHQRNIPQS